MLLVMVSGSAWWLSAANQGGRPTSIHSQHLQTDQHAMIQARQSLLSYASLYPFLYGPSGAGPGHLPCPDTDDLTPIATSQPFAGDSPNPPCGSSSRANGHLPRHVSLPGYRYAFHRESYQRFDYSVYSHVVNNPVNRVVNPSLFTTPNSVAATIELNRPTSVLESDRRAIVRITNANLLQVLRSSIAAWILAIAERTQSSACSAVPQATLAQRCLRLGELQARCVESVQLGNKTNPDAILLLLIDQLPQDDTCISTDPGSSTIEQIAVARHWFFRNHWHEWVQIEFSENCTASLMGCSLVYKAEHRVHRYMHGPKQQSQKLVLRWQLIT